MLVRFAARQDSASVSLQLKTWNSGSVGWRSGQKMARRKEGVSGGLKTNMALIQQPNSAVEAFCLSCAKKVNWNDDEFTVLRLRLLYFRTIG